MVKNIVDFLITQQGFPEAVGNRELQKMDKQSFVKYFNVSHLIVVILIPCKIFKLNNSLLQFIYQYIDPTYHIGARLNEEDLMKNVKEMGYPGTLSKSALVSSKMKTIFYLIP